MSLVVGSSSELHSTRIEKADCECNGFSSTVLCAPPLKFKPATLGFEFERDWGCWECGHCDDLMPHFSICC